MPAEARNAPARRGCALVTGASRGIGAAIARALAADGWPVAINYRTDAAGATEVVSAIAGRGGTALALPGDVSRPPEVERVFAELEQRFDRVLVVVNNAGVRADRLLVQMQAEDWQTVLDTNLSAVLWTCKRALMPMVRARFGRIVNIASVVGVNVGNAGQANYAAAKAGIVGLTGSLAREVARRGVTVNAVAPGFVATEMTADLDPALAQAIPARRAATPAEIASCVRFLVSDEASYVTGATLTVDGGLTA